MGLNLYSNEQELIHKIILTFFLPFYQNQNQNQKDQVSFIFNNLFLRDDSTVFLLFYYIIYFILHHQKKKFHLPVFLKYFIECR